jgi:hypothetical protein
MADRGCVNYLAAEREDCCGVSHVTNRQQPQHTHHSLKVDGSPLLMILLLLLLWNKNSLNAMSESTP